MLLLITASLILCGNVFIVKAEDITTMHYPWSPVSHKSDGIVRSYDVSGGTFIKNNMDDYETDAMNTYVGDHEPPDDHNKLSKMSIHCNSYTKMTIQNNSSELLVTEIKMVPSRSHKIFDDGVVVIALNYDVATNDSCNDDVPETTYRGYDVGLCTGSCNYDEASCVGSVATPASQDSCGTCCAGSDGRMRLLPGMMIHDNYHQKIASTTI